MSVCQFLIMTTPTIDDRPVWDEDQVLIVTQLKKLLRKIKLQGNKQTKVFLIVLYINANLQTKVFWKVRLDKENVLYINSHFHVWKDVTLRKIRR